MLCFARRRFQQCVESASCRDSCFYPKAIYKRRHSLIESKDERLKIWPSTVCFSFLQFLASLVTFFFLQSKQMPVSQQYCFLTITELTNEGEACWNEMRISVKDVAFVNDCGGFLGDSMHAASIGTLLFFLLLCFSCASDADGIAKALCVDDYYEEDGERNTFSSQLGLRVGEVLSEKKAKQNWRRCCFDIIIIVSALLAPM